MPEPLRPRVRLISMTRALALPVLALVLLAGCGSAERGSGDEPESGQEPSTRTTDKTTTCAHVMRAIAKADIDGDGTREEVEIGEGDQACASFLGVAGETGEPLVSVELPADEPPVRSGFAVTVPGREGDLVVTRQDHPRGGFQLRVYAAGDGELVELETDGDPLVPFVALDVQEHPLSIDCTDGGLVVTEAVAHEPAGVMFAWDVKQTTYTLEGTTVTAEPTEEIADNVLPSQLGAKYPDLVKHAAFKSCRTAG